MVDITPIINAIIALIAALVSAFLIPWLKSVVEFLEAKGFKIDFNSIDNMIEAAVYEISQTFGGVTIGEAAETE